jgi:hypothetical protein
MATISAIHNGFYIVKTHYHNFLNLLMHPYAAVECFFHVLEYIGYFHWNPVEDFTNVGEAADWRLALSKDENLEILK